MNQKCNKTTTKILKIFIGASPQFGGERNFAQSPKGGSNLTPLCSPDRESVQIWIDLKIKEIARGAINTAKLAALSTPVISGQLGQFRPGRVFAICGKMTISHFDHIWANRLRFEPISPYPRNRGEGVPGGTPGGILQFGPPLVVLTAGKVFLSNF